MLTTVSTDFTDGRAWLIRAIREIRGCKLFFASRPRRVTMPATNQERSMSINRREFIATAGALAASASLASSLQASADPQTNPAAEWSRPPHAVDAAGSG